MDGQQLILVIKEVFKKVEKSATNEIKQSKTRQIQTDRNEQKRGIRALVVSSPEMWITDGI